ncbi:MAG: hypothetical protein LBQ66_09570 [Planctomycetaceae bacterium]|nr:hypothetical protein [Planctomycetaceae bacterium]
MRNRTERGRKERQDVFTNVRWITDRRAVTSAYSPTRKAESAERWKWWNVNC